MQNNYYIPDVFWLTFILNYDILEVHPLPLQYMYANNDNLYKKASIYFNSNVIKSRVLYDKKVHELIAGEFDGMSK